MTSIVHVTQPTDGGTAAVVRQMIEIGREAGYAVALVCPTGELSDWAIDNRVSWERLNLKRAPRLTDAWNVYRIRTLIRTHDIVHLHSSKAGALGRVALMSLPAFGRPSSAFNPHAWSWCVGGPMARAYKLLERRLANRTNVIIAVSDWEAAEGRRVIGSQSPIRVIENGVDLRRYSAEGPRAAKPDGMLIVQVGRLSYQKGPDRAIRALAMMTNPLVTLRFVGDGPERSNLVRLADDLGVGPRVEFVGSRDPVGDLRAADLVVMPSRWEGMSLVLLEAMSIGCPIVATECGGTNILNDGAVIVQQTDEIAVISDLAETITRILNYPDKLFRMGTDAQNIARSRFGISRLRQEYLALWEELDGLSPRAKS